MKFDEYITYPVQYESDDVFWSMLLNTGYIKPCAGQTEDLFYAELVNREVRNICRIWRNDFFHIHLRFEKL